jgi:hypothetical protein
MLHAIDTAPRDFIPDPITQDEAAAMFRAVLKLFALWAVTDEQAATLLDMPLRTYRRWNFSRTAARLWLGQRGQ